MQLKVFRTIKVKQNNNNKKNTFFKHLWSWGASLKWHSLHENLLIRTLLKKVLLQAAENYHVQQSE